MRVGRGKLRVVGEVDGCVWSGVTGEVFGRRKVYRETFVAFSSSGKHSQPTTYSGTLPFLCTVDFIAFTSECDSAED